MHFPSNCKKKAQNSQTFQGIWFWKLFRILVENDKNWRNDETWSTSKSSSISLKRRKMIANIIYLKTQRKRHHNNNNNNKNTKKMITVFFSSQPVIRDVNAFPRFLQKWNEMPVTWGSVCGSHLGGSHGYMAGSRPWIHLVMCHILLIYIFYLFIISIS